jgi:hypothetical protein
MEFFEDDPLLPEQNAGMRFGAFGGSFLWIILYDYYNGE